MSTAALERALRDAGIAARVEAHGRLAVVVADARYDWKAEARERADAAARAAGFTHVALEVTASG